MFAKAFVRVSKQAFNKYNRFVLESPDVFVNKIEPNIFVFTNEIYPNGCEFTSVKKVTDAALTVFKTAKEDNMPCIHDIVIEDVHIDKNSISFAQVAMFLPIHDYYRAELLNASKL
jgi:hypothetical protein